MDHTVLPAHSRLYTNGMNHTGLCLPSHSWSSFTVPGRTEGWVNLGTTMMSKQSTQDHYMTSITAVNCSNRHAPRGNWSAGLYMSVELTTSLAASHDTIHWTTKGCSLLRFFYTLDCAVETTDRFLSSVSPFMWVESNFGVSDPGAAAARPGTRVVKWSCAELPDCSSMFESWETRVLELSSCFVLCFSIHASSVSFPSEY